MQSQIFRKSFDSTFSLIQIIIACTLGLLVGIASGMSKGSIVLGALVLALLAYATLKRPEIALLGILFATSTIVFEDQLPMVSVGISLHIPDFLLLGSLGLIVLRWIVEPQFKLIRTPLDWHFLIFYGIMIFWTFYAIIHGSVDLEVSRRMIRVMTYYMTFFVVTNLVRDIRQLDLLLNGFFLLATLVAVVMVAQYLLGRSVVLLPGRVETLNTQGVAYSGITRILPPGVSIVLIAFVTIFCVLVLEKFKPSSWVRFLQFGLFGAAVLVTFLRSYWGTLLIVFCLLGFILKGNDREKLIKWSLAIIIPAVLFLLFISSIPNSDAAGLIGASRERLSTIFTLETFQGKDGSLNSRKLENSYAIQHIISHPFTGLGLGATYRPFDWRLDGEYEQRGGTMFLHNGHLWLFLDTGLFGYLSFIGLSITFLFRGFRYWRNITNYRFQGIVLGFSLVYLAILVAAVVNSTFVLWNWTPILGMIMGINEVILMKFRQEEAVAY